MGDPADPDAHLGRALVVAARENEEVGRSGLVQKFPLSTIADKDVRDSLEDGVVYEIAFDGNDSDAEHIEKTTGLTLLGESDEPFQESQTDIANSPDKTTKRQYLARMY